MNASHALRPRLASLDLLRGLVMVIMALDHTRDFFHYDAALHDPLDLSTTTPWLYFTRWITHYCAPVFVFLSGLSIYLQGLRKPANELSIFLFKRGLWLLVVELTIVTFAWTFDPGFHAVALGVIGAIGIGMMCMALIIRLPFRLVLALGLLIVLGHNALDLIKATHTGLFWDLLHNGHFVQHKIGGLGLMIVYPIAPWLGIMVLGYCAGRLYAPEVDGAVRKRMLVRAGTALLVLFVLLRALNVYGDPHPWEAQHDAMRTLFSFLNVEKYPPSLLYTCVTLGPALLFLAFTERSASRFARMVTVFGRVPFFYYMLHLYLLHLGVMVMFYVHGHTLASADMFGMEFNFMVAGEGYRLLGVYAIWIGLVAALYPLCAWFSELKQRNRAWWLSYL